MQFTMADRKINAVISTSAGRLFDGQCDAWNPKKSTFEGEASMALEFAAEAYEEEICGKLMSRQMVKANQDERKERAGRQADYEDRKPYKISDREENRRHSGRKISLYVSSKVGRTHN